MVKAESETTAATVLKAQSLRSACIRRERYVSAREVVIIGAGPYGLSISANLHGLGVDHQIVGRPLDTWRAHMPVGMKLKSEPFGSAMNAPETGYDVAAYCQSHGLDPINRGTPLSLENFLGYGDWFTEQLVPDVGDVTVTKIDAVDGGFRLAFAETEPVVARRVVIATGILPHFHIPAELSGLPPELLSHTSEHRELDRFRGRRVAVVGAGQSALETAALLHEAGADTQLITRCPGPAWHPQPEPMSRVGQIRLPITRLCEGWKCVFWNTPVAFRRLPRNMRITKARTVLGPRGAWWLRDRIEGVIEVRSNSPVRGAEPSGSGVRLLLDDPQRSAVDVDHIMAGTGFRVDLARLAFLPEGLRARIRTLNGHPVLTRAGQSTIPGLYFTGAPAAVSLGPSMRFIAGTHNAASQIARSVASRAQANGPRSPASAQMKHSDDDDAAFQETA
jgi:FAD-dependent urate hydroxylase